MSVRAIYPGTFDPLTTGHVNIVERAARMFDQVVLAVAVATLKNTLFTIDERLALADEVFAGHGNVEAKPFDGLVVDFARAADATVILRGVRGVTDFDYEMQMVGMNRRMAPSVETVFLVPDDGLGYVSSTLVRQIAGLHGDVSPFVPPAVLPAITAKFAQA